MSKFNLCKTRDKKIYEDRDKDYLKLIQEYKMSGDSEKAKKHASKSTNLINL